MTGLLLAGVLASRGAWAQNDAFRQPDTNAPPIQPVATTPQAPQGYSVEFPGGTLEEFVKLLREQDQTLNVVVSGELQEFKLQGMSLHHVTTPTVIAVLRELLGARIQITSVGQPEVTSPFPYQPGSSEMAVTSMANKATPVLLIRRAPNQLITSAFSTKGIKQEGGKPDIAEAISFALKSLPPDETRLQPEVQINADLGIMMVTADLQQLQLISQVVVLLGGETRMPISAMMGMGMPGYQSGSVSQPTTVARMLPNGQIVYEALTPGSPLPVYGIPQIPLQSYPPSYSPYGSESSVPTDPTAPPSSLLHPMNAPFQPVEKRGAGLQPACFSRELSTMQACSTIFSTGCYTAG